MVDLVRVEPTGFPSRYPTTKAGADIHPQLSTIDFAKFVHAVRRSESTLRTWMYQLSADASVQADYFAERRRTRADRAGD
jgi:tRNA(Leu) C34 or U34 (ribose-2'-O)-methylase TrmL